MQTVQVGYSGQIQVNTGDNPRELYAHQNEAIKALNQKDLEGGPIFSGKLDTDHVLEWLECMENYFESENVREAQKVKVKKERMRGETLTWWKSTQDEKVKEGKKKTYANWKIMVSQIQQTYLPEDFEVKLNTKR